jgi:hypothetical protein
MLFVNFYNILISIFNKVDFIEKYTAIKHIGLK